MKQYIKKLLYSLKGITTIKPKLAPLKIDQVFVEFIHSTKGSMMPLIAGGLAFMITLSGMVVDSARLFYARNIMQKSLDAAGLAAGHALSADLMEPSAQEFFNTNFNQNISYAYNTALSMTVSSDNKVISLSASANIDPVVLQMLGFSTMTITAKTEITRETRGMELVLVMDNTGSMRGGDKITAMKDAAKDLVNLVYGNKETAPNLWVGLVPYTSMVNIGSNHINWLNSNQQDNILLHDQYEATSWKGCVMARGSGEDRTDTPPAVYPFDYFFWEDSVDNDWKRNSGSYRLREANSAQNDGRTPNLGCGPAITPLVASKTTVIGAIDEMLPWHRGGTTSNLGLVWGWRAISPKWQGLWGGDSPSYLPLNYDTPYMDKVVVLLTDGNNQFYDWRNHSPDNGYGPSGSDKTGYGRLFDLGVSSLGAGQNILDDNLATTCSVMKNEGIIIYTITFGSSPNSQTQNLYRNCATNGNYFHAPSNGELATIFENIGRQLSNLRLSS